MTFLRNFCFSQVMRCFLVAAALILMTVNAMAETPILSAPDAQAKLTSGDMVLLDIRSPQEWAETGVAEGAWPVSMHDAEFGARLQNILANVPAEQIGLICATGGRTAHVVNILRQNGIDGVIDVSEGMMGNTRGAGWISRGLPVVSLEDATQSFEAATADW